MDWSSFAPGVLTTVLAAGVLALVRTLWDHHRAEGTLVASHEPPSSRGWDATVTVRWRGKGGAWNVLALPYDQATSMTHGTIEEHLLRDGDGELKFQIRDPARVILLWRPGLLSKRARGHLLDTRVGSTRAMTRREVRTFLSR